MQCPYCDSDRLRKKGVRRDKQRFKCKDCYKWFSAPLKDDYSIEKHKDVEILQDKRSLIISILKRGLISIEDLSNATKLLPKEIREIVKGLEEEKYNIQVKDHLFELSKEIPIGNKRYLDYKHWDNNKIKIGFVSDTHLCSKFERLEPLNLIYDIFENEGIGTVYHGGNWIDGEFRFNKYEIHTRGLTPQVEYFIKNYPQRKNVETMIISGDDHEGWFAQRERINIGEYMQMKAEKMGRNDLIDLGYLEADIEMRGTKGNSWLRIMHGGGGSAYALSYTPQKIIESLQGGEKPRVLLLGHYHKIDYCFPREVHVIQMGCFQDQTIFMRKKKLQAHIGGGILELNQAHDGTINRIKVEFITFFDKGFYKGNKKYWK